MDTTHPAPAAVDLAVRGMTCASCALRLEKVLGRVDGVQGAEINYATGLARVAVVPGAVGRAALVAAVEGAGFTVATPNDGEDPEDPVALAAAADAADAREAQALRRDLWMTAAFGLPVVALGMGAMHWEPGWWLQAALSAVVLGGPGRRFFVDGARGAGAGAPDMNTLVALGVGAAWLLSAASALTPSVVPHAIYFESAVVVVGFVLLGRVLEAQARRAAGAAVRALVARVPATARVVVGPAGALEERPAAAVVPGDLVQVWPGEALPVDGVVEQGRATLDTAALTGESAPVPAGPGDTVAAGALCAEGALWVRVSASGRRTGLARAARAVYEAQAHKAPVQRQVDAVSRRFVPAVLGVAVASAAGWLVAGAPVADAILAAVTVLVVACPCALGLATPTAVLVATGRAAREGIWFRDGAALEAAQAARTVVFDKTGTLSQGAFAVAQVEGPPTLLGVAAALEAESTHPLARALRAAAVPGGPTAQGLRSAPGDGVEGTIAGVRWRLGRAGWAGAPPSGTGDAGERVAGTVVHLAADGQWAGAITLVDPPRPEAAAVVAALRAAGRRVVVLSGDGPGPTSRLAAAVGADAWEAGVRPAEKGARVLAWSADGPVVMVGDGVNDGPALAAAAVGVAMAEAADVARQAAGIQLARPDLRLVPAAIALSDATFRTIRHNLVWAFGYNVLALPLAAGALAPWGWRMSPMVAGAAMALSSVSVVLSSLRLRSVRLPAIP